MTQQFVPFLPTSTTGYGFRTPFGVTLPPGSNVAAFLRSTGPQSNDDPAIASNLVTTLAAALLRVRSGLGDTIFVLPGHSESVVDATMLTNLVAGTRILGVGTGGNQPVFRWTAAAAQWLINKADVVIAGLRLRLEGFNGVTVAIDATAADVAVLENDVELSSGAANLATVGLRLSAGADRFYFARNRVRGVAAGVSTDGILINAVVANPTIVDNQMHAAASAANGLVRVAAVAALGIYIARNDIYNVAAASTACIAFGAAANDGMCSYNNLGTLNNGTASAQGITFGAGSLVKAFQNFCSDEPQKSGILAPGPAT